MRDKTFVLICLVLSLSLRLYAQQYNQVIETDGAFYSNLAMHLSQGDGFKNDYVFDFYLDPVKLPSEDQFSPRLYPLILSIFYLLFGSDFFITKIVSVLFGTACVIPFFLFVRSAFSRRIAYISTLIFSISHSYIIFSALALNESVYLFFMLFSFYFLYMAIYNPKLRFSLMCGLFLGLSFLAREQVLLLVIPFVIFIRKKFHFLIAFLSVSVLFVIPNLLDHGSIFLENRPFYKFSHLGNELQDGSSYQSVVSYEEYTYSPHRILEYHQSDIWYAILFILQKGIFVFFDNIPKILVSMSNLLTPIAFILSIIGLLFFQRKFLPIYTTVLLFVIFFSIMPLMPWFMERYLLTISIFLIPFISISLIWISKLRFGNIFIMIIAILFVWQSFYFAKIIESTHNEEFIETLQASNWMKGNVDGVIMSRKPQIAYYSGLRRIPIPYGNFTDCMNAAKAYNATYLVLTERESMYYPNLSIKSRALEEVYIQETSPWIRIYKLNI